MYIFTVTNVYIIWDLCITIVTYLKVNETTSDYISKLLGYKTIILNTDYKITDVIYTIIVITEKECAPPTLFVCFIFNKKTENEFNSAVVRIRFITINIYKMHQLEM